MSKLLVICQKFEVSVIYCFDSSWCDDRESPVPILATSGSRSVIVSMVSFPNGMDVSMV